MEQSLRRLRTDRIDLYQLHWPPDDGTPLEDYWGALLELQASGKIGAAGLSNHSVDQLELADKLGHVNTLQPPFSAINRSSAPEIAWCARHATGVIVYSPMQSGLLTGSFTTQRAASLGEDDWRSHDPEFLGERLTRNLAWLTRCVPSPTGGASASPQWLLRGRSPGRESPGRLSVRRRAAQVDGWLPATQIELTEQELATIADLDRDDRRRPGPDPADVNYEAADVTVGRLLLSTYLTSIHRPESVRKLAYRPERPPELGQ